MPDLNLRPSIVNDADPVICYHTSSPKSGQNTQEVGPVQDIGAITQVMVYAGLAVPFMVCAILGTIAAVMGARL